MSFMSLDVLSMLSDFLGSAFMEFVMDFLSIIPKIAYFIVACMLSLVDLFQVLFRKLAGMDPIIVSGEVVTGDTATNIILDAIFTGKYPAISTVFWSLTILGVFMLVITSITATLRLEYTPDKDTKNNSKKSIIIGFVKAIFTFAIVPVCCFFGMWFTNVLIQTIDTVTTAQYSRVEDSMSYYDKWVGVSGTSSGIVLTDQKASYASFDVFGVTIPTTAQPFSGMLFKASAYSANRLRIEGNGLLQAYNASGFSIGIFDGKLSDAVVAADIIDTGFAMNAKMKNGGGNIEYTDEIEEYYSRGFNLGFGFVDDVRNFSKYNVELVWYFYDLWQLNWIVAFAAVIMIGKLYFKFCLAMMARLFEVAGLFLISPIPVAMMPLDSGAAFGRWRGHFVAKFGLLLVMVFGMNLVSPVLTMIEDIKLFNYPLLDNIVLAMFLVAALNAVDALNSTISFVLFGRDFDSYNNAMNTAGKAISNLQSGLSMTKSVGKIAAAPVKIAGKTAGRAAMAGGRKLAKKAPEWAHSARQHHYDKAEKNAIKDKVSFDGKEAMEGMGKDKRKDMVDDFMKTDQGKAFMRDYYESQGLSGMTDKNHARNALIDGTASSEMFDSYATGKLKDEHDRNMFSQSSKAGEFAAGSAEYEQAFREYQGLSDGKKASYFMGEGTTAISDQQQRVRDARVNAHADLSYHDYAAFKANERAAKIQKFQSSRLGGWVSRSASALKRGVANFAGDVNHAISNPKNGAKKEFTSLKTGMFTSRGKLNHEK